MFCFISRKMTLFNWLFDLLQHLAYFQFSRIINHKKKIRIRNRLVMVEDPTEVFERALTVLDFEKYGRDYMWVELAPYPLALFNDTGMRKGKKSQLFTIFNHHSSSVLTNRFQYYYIIDGVLNF